ncbi:MAG: Mobile element protein, partial [Olavius algarvensis Gamma 1 endosymbiont]
PLPAHRPLHARPERRKPQPPCQGLLPPPHRGPGPQEDPGRLRRDAETPDGYPRHAQDPLNLRQPP